MHNRQLCVSQEIRRAAEAVQHSRSHRVRRVGMGVLHSWLDMSASAMTSGKEGAHDVNFQRCIHSDHTQAADELGRVGNLL